MKSYLSLIPISARVRKKQNKMTMLCIILAVFLVTGIFSMADMGVRAESIRMLKKHGNWHVMLTDISEQEMDAVSRQSNVASTSWYNAINAHVDENYYIMGMNAFLVGADEALVKDIMYSYEKGRYPLTSQEAMLSSNARTLLGVALGDSVTVNTPAGDIAYTVCGFSAESEFDRLTGSVSVYLNRTAFGEVEDINRSEASISHEPSYYVQFRQSANVRTAIADLKQQYGFADAKVKENTSVLGMSGDSSHSTMLDLYGIASVLFVVVLIAGVLMISSSINSNVAVRTQFFGMLRCIGASKRQISHFVKLEALNWCKTAIPIGEALAILATWGICAVMRFCVGGELAEIPLFAISAVGVLCGIIVGIATVLMASLAPAKRASRTAPITAVSGGADTEKNIRRATNLRLGRVETALGIHHAVSAKKNLFLMTASFAVSIVLFLSFEVGLAFIQNALPSLRSYTPDVAITSNNGSCTIDRELADALADNPHIKQIYGNMFSFDLAVSSSENGIEIIDLVSYDEYMMNFSKKNLVLEGDLSKTFGNSHYVAVIYNHKNPNPPQVGDTFQIGTSTLEVACVLSRGIWGEGMPTVICSEETFTRLTGETDYTMLNFKLTRKATEEDVDVLRGLVKEKQSFSDYRALNKESTSTYWLFYLLIYGFLAMIALITVINIVNSISMSVSSRIRQYGAMRAIGMELRQIDRMITAEALTYAVSGSIVGSALGIPMNRAFFHKLVAGPFGISWTLPVEALVVILLLVFVSVAFAVYAPSKRIRNMAITDTINEL